MRRNISENQEVNKARHFARKTNEELEYDLKVYQAMNSDNKYLSNNIIKELEKRKSQYILTYPIYDTVKNFHNSLNIHSNHRYKSWEYCFNAFQEPTKTNDELSLHLGFYLASWGMLRGSTGLLWKDYKVHKGAVEIIQSYNEIHCSINNEVNFNHIDEILKVKEELVNYYENIEYTNPMKGSEMPQKISATDTLITKVLLGTLGCIPAYDRLFKDGIGQIDSPKIQKTFNEKSLYRLFEFINHRHTELTLIQNEINKEGVHYPLMKIVDMYFWEVGNKCQEKTNK